MQLSYTTQHEAVLTIFLLYLQTTTTAQMLSIVREAGMALYEYIYYESGDSVSKLYTYGGVRRDQSLLKSACFVVLTCGEQ